ncbi:MAG: NADH-quinone oxidoreductase subunit L [Geminicoccaceae bacterium]|nr:MAG: NADH-quinone oxidoreductase subunit L [Geminicoccaceae bacterium]
MYTAIVFLPLLGAIVAGLFGRIIGDRAAQIVTCSLLCISALLSGIALLTVPFGEPFKVPLATWIVSGSFEVDWALRIDALTVVMLVVVTWVSALVHIYSIGYMSHDASIARFMSYLSLFTFAMLMLVTADNFLQLFFGWEGVGVASYLLIGFWYEKASANNAAMKAFIVNRVGDFALILGIAAIFLVFDSVDFDTVFAAAPAFAEHQIALFGVTWSTLDLICILLFIGAMGKSAQLGLHTWLPDAMEGPTPVSALIHAATMVTAGVFLIARVSPIIEYAPVALAVIVLIGATTAFFAATVALTQNDIKRVIAYSTCSQLGYMFFALGVGAYAAAIFHLFTHAFFKALLFLAAGSVIHGMSNEQDMRRMGGIWRHMKFTYAMMWIGSLALVGVPFFAGFYSKDLILEAAFAAGGVGFYAFALGIAAAVMTAFYSGRLLFMTFHGKPRASEEVMHHVHESPLVMTIPLGLLAVGAVFAGYLGLPMVADDHAFWGGSIYLAEMERNIIYLAHYVPTWVVIAPIVAGFVGLGLAYVIYIQRTELADRLAERFRPLYQFSLNKWYFDELYDALFVRPARQAGTFLWRRVDAGIIDDYGPNGVAATALEGTKRVVKLQTGYIYHYAFVMLIGVAALVSWFLFVARG